jgi:hypothetical protein
MFVTLFFSEIHNYLRDFWDDNSLNEVKRTKNKQWSKTLHRKLRIEQHEPHLKPMVNSGAPDG